MTLRISNVRKAYGGKDVLKDISFEVAAHEFVCILGHSGCGKSTLLNLIAGYVQPDGGSITVSGEAVTRPSRSRGVVFQDHALFPWFKVIDNIAFGPEVQGLAREEARKVAREYLKLIGLEEYANHYPSALSGGMKQRVGIARALAGRPEILLMDEPFGALDILTRDTMRRELLRIWLQLRTMVLFVTHSISEAIHLADRIVVMKSGSIAGIFEVQMARPRHIQDGEFVKLLTELEGLLTSIEAVGSEPEGASVR